MKIVKFLSFIMLLSIASVACKDNSKTEQTAENTTEALENAMQTSKTELGKTLSELQVAINLKITEAVKELESASATEEAKADINTRLDTLRKQLTDVETLTIKVGETTTESWAEFEKNAAQKIADIKEAINK